MKKHICTHCGEEFTGKKRKYCNDKCRYEYNKVRKRKQYRLGNNIKSRSCPICDKEFEPNRKGALTKYCSQNCADEARRIRNRERWREANPEWDKDINKVCEWCGKSYEVKPKYASQSRFCSSECQQTWYSRKVRGHGPREEYIEERRKKSQERQVRLEKEREQQLSNLKCIECGGIFKGTSLHQKLCSTECGRVRRNKQQRLCKDKRINDDNNIDKDISLETLYKRDKGICYICGGKCDFGDHTQTNGYFTAGPNYPSIDHIIPIARGGMHAWDNVKLAHHHCNSMKSDILPSELGLDIDIDDAYALAREISPHSKEVKQLTKEGKLINIYKSTAEAERQTGVKSKGIQKCARGECKTYRGFKWEYV